MRSQHRSSSSSSTVTRIGFSLLFAPLTSRLDVVSAFVPSPSFAFVKPEPLLFQQPQQPRPTVIPTPLLLASRRADLDVVFGSSSTSSNRATNNQSSLSSSWEDDDDADDDDDDDDDDNDKRRHHERVQELLAETDAEYRNNERKQQKWGKFANVTSDKDLSAALAEERDKIQAQDTLKARLANESGVCYTVLEPKEPDGNSFWEDESGHVRIQAGTSSSSSLSTSKASSSSSSFFAEMDQDLADEWQALTGDAVEKDQVLMEKSSGQIVARDALSGIRVGSAGGWTLEVFPGDFVVHRKYGIGRFEQTRLRPKTKLTPDQIKARDERRAQLLTEELRKRKHGVTPDEIQKIRSKFGTEQDTDPISNPQTTVLEIAYADALVHVPVDRAYRLSRYRAGDAVVKPRLSRVRGEAWSKAKAKVEENTLQLAQDVLALYATRETLSRQPFDPAVESKVKEFEATFPYEATPDQTKCFEDVENDMVWRSRPMDRLVCGDVGFGKTEVAFRALYRAVANGKQAAMLAPTGVLAAQHYKNVVNRMGPDTPFNVTIVLLRGGMGSNTKNGRIVREQIGTGEIQLVVGTHALLSNDVNFKDLGVLVVDEEQRFGVKQKERLKLICSGVDVLTLSATPIPRTLQMSLSGIRDTSTIRSPPPMRKPTISYVQEFNEDIVQHAISTELERGGQCYYVVPRICMLDDAEKTIKKLFPEIRVVQAHGRMHRNGAEENVAEFAEGKYDVLLATTVIENGVDIPTVNTIIIESSQVFGMSTLYQLRGRVGRSDQRAFAYFLHREESITEQAAMRLQAIGELSELGSGFDVANRDLEIRGAGSLLGTEQSGMAARVGFDLYMRMLKKSIRKLRGLDLPLVPRTNVLLPTEGTPDTFSIPESMIPDKEERRKQESKARLAESTAALVALTNEWKEKYGNLPAMLQNQLKTMHLHACTRRLGIDLVGLVEQQDDDEDGRRFDCVLRSPGLRPRHWATILPLLPRGVAPKGLDVVFPARFTVTGEDTEIRGGSKTDLKALLTDETLSEDHEEEEWDAMDEEEVEAMKDISSAVNVKDMDEVDLEQYPHFVIKNFAAADSKAVDRLLKVLLPIAKAVYEKQEEQAEEAKVAADLREKQELLRMRKKQNGALESQRLGFNYESYS